MLGNEQVRRLGEAVGEVAPSRRQAGQREGRRLVHRLLEPVSVVVEGCVDQYNDGPSLTEPLGEGAADPHDLGAGAWGQRQFHDAVLEVDEDEGGRAGVELNHKRFFRGGLGC